MEGDCHEVSPHVMNVASTGNDGFVLEFELNVANVEYLYGTFSAFPPEAFVVRNRLPRTCLKLPSMYPDTPNVVERPRYRGASVMVAFTKYTTHDGPRQKSKVIDVTEEHKQLGVAEQKRRDVAVEMQRFYDESHREALD